jgi:hypothetical protein
MRAHPVATYGMTYLSHLRLGPVGSLVPALDKFTPCTATSLASLWSADWSCFR